jgi:hypothetical protein
MEENEPFPLKQTLGALAETRKHLAQIEAVWKAERAMSKRLTLSLVNDYGYSILQASNVSGHGRLTIKTWVEASHTSTRE